MTVSVPVQECAKMDLEPCPFCGGTRLVIMEEEFNGKMLEWVECASSRCGAFGPTWRKTRDHMLAVKYWNIRIEGKKDE